MALSKNPIYIIEDFEQKLAQELSSYYSGHYFHCEIIEEDNNVIKIIVRSPTILNQEFCLNHLKSDFYNRCSENGIDHFIESYIFPIVISEFNKVIKLETYSYTKNTYDKFTTNEFSYYPPLADTGAIISQEDISHLKGLEDQKFLKKMTDAMSLSMGIEKKLLYSNYTNKDSVCGTNKNNNENVQDLHADAALQLYNASLKDYWDNAKWDDIKNNSTKPEIEDMSKSSILTLEHKFTFLTID